jgi:hypothetical protein
MSEQENHRAELKKLSARATQAKMDLHDLSEEPPIGWQDVLKVAQTAHDAYAALERKRAEIQFEAGT